MKTLSVFMKFIAIAVYFSAPCEVMAENNCRTRTLQKECTNTTLTESVELDNGCTTLTVVNCSAPHLFRQVINFPQLQNIHIKSSQLNDSVSELALTKLENLHLFEISYSSLTKLPSNLFYYNPSLGVVNLVGNKLENIITDMFINNNKLVSLNLSHNVIDNFNSNAFNMKNCENNDTEDFKFDLSYNKLKKIEFMSCAKITHLFIDNNLIENITCGSLENVRTLKNFSLAHNKIQIIAPGAFKSMKALIHLDVRYNYLREVNRNWFEGADALVVLLLDGNEIRCIERSALQDLTSLRELGLESNLLIKLDITQLPEIFHHNLTSDLMYCSYDRVLLNSTVLSKDCKEKASRMEDAANLCKCDVDARYKKLTEVDGCQSREPNSAGRLLSRIGLHICFLIFIIINL